MTLVDAIQEIERQMDTFMTVYLDSELFTLIERATRTGEDDWSHLSRFKARFVMNKHHKWVYEMTLGEAEEMRDVAREVVARQVTEKLTQGTK